MGPQGSLLVATVKSDWTFEDLLALEHSDNAATEDYAIRLSLSRTALDNAGRLLGNIR